jgi:hypothetical protein
VCLQACLLWRADNTSDVDQDIFYVKQLEPQVCPSDVEAGSKLKKMSNIPGWKPLHPLDVTAVQVRYCVQCTLVKSNYANICFNNPFDILTLTPLARD